MIRRQLLRQAAALHNDERQTVGQAPVLVGSVAIKLDSSDHQLALEWHYFDTRICTDTQTARCGNLRRAHVRHGVEPFQENSPRCQDRAPGSDHKLMPRDGIAMVLVPFP